MGRIHRQDAKDAKAEVMAFDETTEHTEYTEAGLVQEGGGVGNNEIGEMDEISGHRNGA